MRTREAKKRRFQVEPLEDRIAPGGGSSALPETGHSFDARPRQGVLQAGSLRRPIPIPENVPLTELTGTYQGMDGGLYGRGRNEPPEEHARAAEREAALIQPLDRLGRSAPDGKIGLVAIGPSTTLLQFAGFQRIAANDAPKAPNVILVNGAQDEVDSQTWAHSDAPWRIVDSRLAGAGISPQQVQVLWIKADQIFPQRHGPFPAHARRYAADLSGILRAAQRRFPNLRIALLSSMLYGGYMRLPLNPEPYSYESAFGVRMVIEAQMGGDPGLNYDASRGPVRSPLVLWGPYLWADASTPRRADGLTWERGDFWADGVHPSASGSAKVAVRAVRFFTTESFARTWFL